MPGIQDWRMTPLVNISQKFDEDIKSRDQALHLNGNDGIAMQQQSLSGSENQWKQNVSEFFAEKLKLTSNDEWRKEIPSINITPNHLLIDGQLVRFEGMIQDMFDPEYFMSEYKIRDLSTGKVRLASGRYRDFADVGPREEILHDDAVRDERQTFYCVSVPGEAPWVQDVRKNQFPEFVTNATQNIPSTSNPGRATKRGLEEAQTESSEQMDVSDTHEGSNLTEAMKDEPTAKKRASVSEEYSEIDNKEGTGLNNSQKAFSAGSPKSLNLPIPNSKGQAVIVKLYDVAEETFSVNDVVEFVGIISLDPSLAQIPLEGSDDMFAEFQQQENAVRNPPASLVPRIHVLHYNKITHSNPLLPAEKIRFEKHISNNLTTIQNDAKNCRKELHAMLEKVLLGDSLAADYLICHLISRIYHRRDVLCLGKFSLNVFNIPTSSNYAKRLSTLLQLLVTKSHYLPLTVANLNGMNFVPKKDYHANRLVSGLLQLSSNTHLLLDETVMENGQLTSEGLKNLTAIGHLISWQKVEYNFNYHQIEFISDVPALVLSDGRSMLPNDSQIMLKPADVPGPTVIDESFNTIGSMMNAELLNKMRTYLTVVQYLTYQLNDDIQKAVQEDFVQERRMRNSAANNGVQRENGQGDNSGGNANRERVGMSTDDLHAHLVLARLLGLSRGETTLSKEIWEETKQMERLRKERASHLPPQRNGFQPGPAGLHV